MSMSTAADMCAGSRSPMSSTIGKLSVWSAASVSLGPPPPPPQAATVEIAPSATARERNKENRVIPPPTKHGLEEGALVETRPSSTSIALFPVCPGARVRRRRTSPPLENLRVAPLLHLHI